VACPICFGGDDLVVRESLNAGIGVLMGVTVVVLLLFARFVAQLARRADESAQAVTSERWDAAWGQPSRQE
jgi:hypothetical protein